ncbi:UDP-N-acetylmuramoyl-L-alanine--D-glutamate ligase [Anthocerotibacter panamensis]|uniref:UDP-N-acetylmuramoyl-L-alanine--D-glutamate ligase n=1 Tax=Anthocerotibacter panamensis TaxID=2857077 RepID=UPI001C401F0F|nr:UDP-N-acetylmuramoyl-L-alanine--D-glutamate ligase [Anthocerotibacter panamensis]
MQLAAVIGLGLSGQAAALLLRASGWSVAVWDSADTPTLRQKATLLQEKGIDVYLGQPFIPDPRYQQVVVSPGVPWGAPFLVEARRLGLTVQGEVGLAWESLQEVPWIAVTGTNGKTTTTALIAAIWKQAGWVAPVCGNIGRPIADVALDYLTNRARLDWVVAELSSFQIEQSPQIQPQIALWTTFSPDHLNRHGTLENYSAIKASLLDHAHQPILNGDDPHVKSLHARWPHALWTSTTDRAAPIHSHEGQVWIEGEPILPVSQIQLPGQHNVQNVLMAVAAAHAAGIAPAMIAQGIREFPGVPHRLECLGLVEGVAFINDSKATNYEASTVGLAAMTAPVILLAGGQMKQGDPQIWLEHISRLTLGVVLYGSAAPRFAQFLVQFGYNAFQVCGTLEEAVPLAWRWAVASKAPCVLLSPACASYDQFANFEARGDRFRQIFEQLGSRG